MQGKYSSSTTHSSLQKKKPLKHISVLLQYTSRIALKTMKGNCVSRSETTQNIPQEFILITFKEGRIELEVIRPN